MRTKLIIFAAALILALPVTARLLRAQNSQTPEQLRASYETRKHDFDYLLGDWEFIANGGEFHGFWTAIRLEDGQILDQFRVTGNDGATLASTVSVRS